MRRPQESIFFYFEGALEARRKRLSAIRGGQMRKGKTGAAILVALLAMLATSTLPQAASARANCYRWDGSDSFRCFDCMKQEWIEGGWHRVNTCAPRRFPKPSERSSNY